MSMPRTQSLERAIGLLHAVGARPDGASASELARATGLPRSTVARTLRTLADAALVDEGQGGWVLGHELVNLARLADPNRRLVEAARPVLGRLRDECGESALLGVPRGRPGMQIVLQLDPSRHVGVASWVGEDVPLHASAAGKLVLADLTDDELGAWPARRSLVRFTAKTLADERSLRAEIARVRRQGWAELADELEDGLASLSVPLRSPGGELVAMAGLSGPTFRLGRRRRRELLPLLRAAATEIEQRL
jgi:DNA-binding IclR family transcriptional regulator